MVPSLVLDLAPPGTHTSPNLPPGLHRDLKTLAVFMGIVILQRKLLYWVAAWNGELPNLQQTFLAGLFGHFQQRLEAKTSQDPEPSQRP